LGAEPDIGVVVEGRRFREVDRRPGEPLRVRFERRRDHPVDREERDHGPGGEHRIAHDRAELPSPRPGHGLPSAGSAYIASSARFSRRSSRIATSTMTIISSMTMYDIAAPLEISKYCQVVRKM